MGGVGDIVRKSLDSFSKDRVQMHMCTYINLCTYLHLLVQFQKCEKCSIGQMAVDTGLEALEAIKSGVSDIFRCLDKLRVGKTEFIMSVLSQQSQLNTCRHRLTGTHSLQKFTTVLQESMTSNTVLLVILVIPTS